MSTVPKSVEQDLINLITESAVLRSEKDGLEYVVDCMEIKNNRLAEQNDFLRWMFVMLVLANRNNTNE